MLRRLLLICLLGTTPLLPAVAPGRAAAVAPRLQLVIEPDPGGAPLVAFSGAARRTLDGEIYLLTDQAIEDALTTAAARGVTVRINLEPHPFGTRRSVVSRAYAALAAGGVQVRYTSSRWAYTHAKYLVADRARLWAGTMNWSAAAFAANREYALVDDEPAAVGQAEAIFAADWVHASYRERTSALVVSPINARATLTALIASARRSLDLETEELNDPTISAALVAAAARGVRVRLVTTAGDALPALPGVEIRRDPALYMHAKVILVDAGAPGAHLFLGSENFSAGSLDRNRELGLVVNDPAILGAMEATFTTDLAASGPAAAPPAATPATTPPPNHPGGSVLILVSPNPVPYGAYPAVTVRAAPGAVCRITVRYASGHAPTTYPDHTATADPGGTIREQGRWHMESRSAGGTVRAACLGKGGPASGVFAFLIG